MKSKARALGMAAMLLGIPAIQVAPPSTQYLAEPLERLNQESLDTSGVGTLASATVRRDRFSTFLESPDGTAVPVVRDMALSTQWADIKVEPGGSVPRATLTKGKVRACWETIQLKGGGVWTEDGTLVDDRGTVELVRCRAAK